MAVETVKSENGDKDHIVVDEIGGLHGIVVACGHDHFEGPTEQQDDVESINNPCHRCKERYIREYR